MMDRTFFRFAAAALSSAVLLASCAGTSAAPRPTAYSSPANVSVPSAQPVSYASMEGNTELIPAYNSAIDEEPMFAASSVPYIRPAAYLLLDANTGKHLASRNAETPRAVASTQKIVTALVVLDAGNLDKPVRVTEADVNVEPTRLGLRAGEVYTRRELLYAFLIKSANDVANVLARDNAGSISAFAAKMNAKARSVGCTNSNFRNPHGLTVPGQYSTARDMSRIAMAAFRNPTIRDAVRRKYYTFRLASGRTITVKNTNDLLGAMPECNGMKTGYTVASGRCLISTATSRGRSVILVQLGTKTKYIWDDGRLLMTWGLQRARSGSVAANW